MERPDWKAGDKLEVIESFKNMDNDLPLGKVVEFVRFNEDEFTEIKPIDGCVAVKWYTRRFRKIVEPKALPIVAEGQKQMTFEQAYEQARALRIVGRGSMNKAQLLAAIVAAKAAPAVKPAAPLAAPMQPPKPTLGEELRNKTGNNPGTCSYAMEWDSGLRRFQVGDVCHARMRRSANYQKEQFAAENQPIKHIVLDVAGHHSNHGSKEAYTKWVDYIINRSPFASSFLTKDVAFAMKEGIYLDVNKPLSQLVAAAMGLRQASEFPQRLNEWSRLVKMGFSEKAAHLMCHHIKGFTLMMDCGGHSPFNGTMSSKELFLFFKGGFADKKEKSAREDFINYSIFASISEYGNGDDVLSCRLEKLLKVEKGQGWGAAKSFTERSLFAAMEEIEKNITA